MAGSTSSAGACAVQHSLGQIARRNARFLMQLFQRQDELVHAEAFVGGRVLLQQDAQVICVQHRVLRGFVQALASERKNVAERADADQEVAVEGTDRADGAGSSLKA